MLTIPIRLKSIVQNEATRTQITRDLQTAQSSIQTMGDDAQKKLDQMRMELLAPVEQKTAIAVRMYATEHSLKIVLDSSVLRNGLVYTHDTADITTEIIRRIAANLQAPGKLDASVTPQPLLNRTWLKFDFRAHTHVPDRIEMAQNRN